MKKFIVFCMLMTGMVLTPTMSQASVVGKTHGLKSKVKYNLNKMSKAFGRPVHVVSGCRSHRHNRKIGGARRSQHLRCAAADIRITGIGKYRMTRWWKKNVGGGVGIYKCSGFVHVDIGPSRSWTWGCKKKRKFRRVTRKKYKNKRRIVKKSTRNYRKSSLVMNAKYSVSR